MAEWIVCPGCGLRHSRRADGICPKCKQPVDAAAAPAGPGPAPGRMPDVYDGSAPPRQGIVEPRDAADAAPLGTRVAGVVMILNGLALFAVTALGVSGGQQAPGTSAGILFGLAIGAGLLTGNAMARTTARWLVPLAGIGLTIYLLAKGQTAIGIIQGAYVAGLMMLLFGDAGKVRIAIGALATGVMLTSDAVLLVGLLTGSNPLARLMMAGELDPLPSPTVQGVKIPYRLGMPNDKWFLRKAEKAHKDNAMVDRWLVRPDQDAHVLVIAEMLPGNARADMERFVAVVLKNAKDSSSSLEVLDQADLPTRLSAGRIVHVRRVVKGVDVEGYFGLFIQDQYIFQVVAFSARKSFPAVAPDLKQIVASFQFP